MERKGGSRMRKRSIQEEDSMQNSSKKGVRRKVRQDKYKGRVKLINRNLREEDQLLVNYTDIVLSEDKLKVGWRGKNFVPDRQHINRTDIEAGLSRLKRDMRWDLHFQREE